MPPREKDLFVPFSSLIIKISSRVDFLAFRLNAVSESWTQITISTSADSPGGIMPKVGPGQTAQLQYFGKARSRNGLNKLIEIHCWHRACSGPECGFLAKWNWIMASKDTAKVNVHWPSSNTGKKTFAFVADCKHLFLRFFEIYVAEMQGRWGKSDLESQQS